MRLLERRGPAPLRAEQVVNLLCQGHVIVDIRSMMEFSRGHVRSAVNIPLAAGQFYGQAGRLLRPGTPIVLIDDDTPDTLRDDTTNVEQAAAMLARIGFDQVAGYLDGGLGAWQRADLPVVSIALHQTSPEEVAGLLAGQSPGKPQLIDVREPWEWEQGHLPEAIHIPLGQLERRACEVDRCRPAIAYCRGGARSQTAAAMLTQLGQHVVYNLVGGIEAWRRDGYPVTTS